MPSVLYSTTCLIKQDLYRLRIYVNTADADSTKTTSSSLNQNNDEFNELTAIDPAVDFINPSLAHINFQMIGQEKKNLAITNNQVPETISLNYLLNVKQLVASPIKLKRNVTNSMEKSLIDSSLPSSSNSTPGTPLFDQSQETNTSASINSDRNQIQMKRRPYLLRRFFSIQSDKSTRSAALLPKTIIRLYFVDVSNLIQWKIKTVELLMDSEEIANELYAHLILCLSTLKNRPHRLLAFVNPLSGKGQARGIFDKKVLPIFEEADVAVRTIYTERANHAREFVMNESLTEYDGLICVGGDGMFSELCHGLLLRTLNDAEKNIDDLTISLIRPKMRIGIIPAGSTDAVVFGTTGLNDPVTSALQIIVGESLSIDITTVHNENGFVRFMATMLAYGFFGDIIQQSDRWRCLGPLRYDLAGFLQFIRNKSYHTELTMTLSAEESAKHTDSQTVSSLVSTDTTSTGPFDRENLLNNDHSPTFESIRPSISSNSINQIRTPKSPFCSRNCGKCSEEERTDYDRIHMPVQLKREGRYTTVNCLNMPCRCAKSKYGMSPFVHLGDGTFDLLLVKRSWRTGFLRFLWQVANDSRSIEDLPNIERYRVSEVHIRPKHTAGRRLGNWACDGELFHGTEIQVRVHRQALSLFASGIQFKEIQISDDVKPKSKDWFPCFRKEKSDIHRSE